MAINSPITTVSVSGSSPLYGGVILQADTGTSLSQTSQVIKIGASPTIGGTIVGGTSGSVLFVGLSGGNPILQQDNANFFWDDANNRLGLGTITPSSHLQITNAASGDIAVIVKAAASQSADLWEAQNSSGTVMTNYNSKGWLNFGPANYTSGQTQKFITINDGTTITGNALNPVSAVIAAGTYNFTADQAAFANHLIFLHSTVYKNDPSLTGSIGLANIHFYNAPTYQADTNATTSNTVGAGFGDNPTFSRINAGTLTVGQWINFQAGGTSNTGVTITNRRGLWVNNVAGGTITTQTGVEIDDISTGTTKIGIRQKGTNAHNRIVGATSIGNDAAPTAQLDVIPATSATIGQLIKGAASQSADLLRFQNSSGTNLASFTALGNLVVGYDSISTSNSTTYITTNNATATINAAVLNTGLTNSGIFLMTASQTGGSILGVNNTYTVINGTSFTGNIGPTEVGFLNQITFTGDTNATSIATTSGVGFLDNNTFNRANAGTLAVTEWNGFKASGTSATGVTITNRRGLWINDISAGTITTQTGIEIDDLTNGTTKIGIRQKGTNAHNRLVSKTYVGSDTAPTTQLQVLGDFCTTQTAVTMASPTSLTTTGSNSFKISAASGNFTVNASTAGTAGQFLFLQWSADAGGSRTITYGTNFNSTGTQTSGGASKAATSLWMSDGSAWREMCRTNSLA